MREQETVHDRMGTGDQMYKIKLPKAKWKLSRATEIVIYTWIVGTLLYGSAMGAMALMS